MAYLTMIHEEVVTSLPEIFGSLTLREFLWAGVAVHSRFFAIKTQYSTAVIPILDTAEHNRLSECNGELDYSPDTGFAIFTATTELPAGATLFHSYRERADGELLNNYGFTLGYAVNGDLSVTHLEFPFMRCFIMADVRVQDADRCMAGLRGFVSSSTEASSPRSRHEELLVFQAIIEETTRKIEEIGSTSADHQILLDQLDEVSANPAAVGGDEHTASLFNKRNCLVVVFGELKVLEAWHTWAVEMKSVLGNAPKGQPLAADQILRKLTPITGLESYVESLEKASHGWSVEDHSNSQEL